MVFSSDLSPSLKPEKLKKGHGKFTRGKSIAVRASPQSPDYDYQDDFGKKNANFILYFYQL